MDEERSVFDRLDGIENKLLELERLEDIENKLSDLNKHSTAKTIEINTNNNRQQFLDIFVKSSKKEHVWFGYLTDFHKSKIIVYVLGVIFIILGIVSTIFTSIAFKAYSTFSLFENIWLIFGGIMLSYSIYAKKRMLDTDLRDHSSNIFMQDANGTWRDTHKEKKRFRWFRRISYFAVFANIIVIWAQSQGGIAIVATVLEIAYAGVSVGLYYADINLFCMYDTFILFTGRNLADTQNVTLVFDVIGKKLLPYEELKIKMEDLI
ncbi:MAG: hypothetical protein IJ706_08990 [Clostridia bacterium]|nr:hypothetical protein [Clostridia bacterium]